METTRLSTKGQIVLPKSVRDSHAWGPGTEFSVEETRDGILLRPARLFPKTEIDQVVGCLRYKGKAKTLKEMESAIRIGVMRRHESGRY